MDDLCEGFLRFRRLTKIAMNPTKISPTHATTTPIITGKFAFDLDGGGELAAASVADSSELEEEEVELEVVIEVIGIMLVGRVVATAGPVAIAPRPASTGAVPT